MVKCEKKGNNKGFSLVELIIIIAIMIILTVAISLSIMKYMEQARMSKDVYNASMIKNALACYDYPSDFQGRFVEYKDPETGEKEVFERGWVYVDRDEIRCSDQSTALAMIKFGLVHVSPEAEAKLEENENSSNRWFPQPGDGDFYRVSGIGEYVFRNNLKVQARRSWNTYQLDVYMDDDETLSMGASASNTERTHGHEKDAATAKYFYEQLGFSNAKITPIGEQYRP